jgi:Cu2+-exporting ATPase
VSARSTTACQHCGTPFFPQAEETEFCCAGCRAVSRWIQSEGLGRFYDLKGDRITQAAGSLPFEPNDWAWAEEWRAEAERALEPGETATAEIAIQGMSCAACAWLIERRFEASPGAVSAGIFPADGTARLSWRAGEFSLPDFASDLARFGYRARPAEGNAGAKGRTGIGLPLGLCGALWMNTMAFTLPRYFGLERSTDLGLLCDLIALASASLSVLVGGSLFFRRAANALVSRILHIDLPISLGIAAAYLGSLWGWLSGVEALFYFDFVATFIFLMLLGRWVQERAVQGARHRGERERFLPREHRDLVPGDEFTLPSGGIVPVEARLLGGSATYSLEWINGEPEALVARSGERLAAGARLLSREPVRLQAMTPFAGSLLSRLLEGGGPARVDPLLQRVLALYVGCVLVLAALGALGWILLAGDAVSALQAAISVLVVSCPCALGVSVPLLNARAAAHLGRQGLFLRDLSLWNRLSDVRQVVFDKTGTLTLPVPRLRNPQALDDLTDDARLALSVLVRDNRHPFARSLEEALAAARTTASDVSPAVHEEPGAGVCFRDASGTEWSLGKDGFRTRHDADLALARDGFRIASFRFEEAVRPDAARAVAGLRRLGYPVAVLSGDRPERVRAVAAEAGIPEDSAWGRLRPEDKAEWLRTHGSAPALFLGDGANDSLGFDAAHASGTPVAGPSVLEAKADFFFLGRGLSAVTDLLLTHRRRRAILRQLFLLAVTYNAAAVAFCLAGLMSPLVAAVIMPLSSVVSVASASRPWLTSPARP